MSNIKNLKEAFRIDRWMRLLMCIKDGMSKIDIHKSFTEDRPTVGAYSHTVDLLKSFNKAGLTIEKKQGRIMMVFLTDDAKRFIPLCKAMSKATNALRTRLDGNKMSMFATDCEIACKDCDIAIDCVRKV
jgi:hypothetical protein